MVFEANSFGKTPNINYYLLFVRKNCANGGFEGIKHARFVLQKAVVFCRLNRADNSVKKPRKTDTKPAPTFVCKKRLF